MGKHMGYHIPRSHLEASYARVHGAPANVFGVRRIERRVYKVPGPNSLWHHDRQHGMCAFLFFEFYKTERSCFSEGLIRWKIVIHAFIDGFSRFITALQASSNNLAQTVVEVFLDAIDVHGIPS